MRPGFQRLRIQLKWNVARCTSERGSEILKRFRKPLEIVRVSCVCDVDVVARIRRAAGNTRHPSDQDEVDLVLEQLAKHRSGLKISLLGPRQDSASRNSRTTH